MQITLSPPSGTLQVLTRRLHGDGKRRPALRWHHREQEICPSRAALSNSLMMKSEGEVESERRRKGSILLLFLSLRSALQLQFNKNEISMLTSPDFRLRSPKFWKAQLKLSHQSWQECLIATATTYNIATPLKFFSFSPHTAKSTEDGRGGLWGTGHWAGSWERWIQLSSFPLGWYKTWDKQLIFFFPFSFVLQIISRCFFSSHLFWLSVLQGWHDFLLCSFYRGAFFQQEPVPKYRRRILNIC